MEKYFSIKTLSAGGEEKASFAFQNACCFPLLSLISEYCDSKDLLILNDRLVELSSKEICEYLNLTERDVEEIIKRDIFENIKSGVSEMGIVSLNPILCKKLFEKYGMSGIVYLRAKDLDDLPKVLEEFKGNKIKLGISVDPYIDGDDLTSLSSEVSGKFKLPVLVTLFDDLEKTGMLSKMFDKPPIHYIEDVGLLDRQCLIYGCIYADKDDFSVMSGYNAKVAVSMLDALNLGKGIANIYAMQNAGVDVKLCSPISNDILEELRLASILSRGLLSDSEVLPISETLEMALSRKARLDIDEKELLENKAKCEEILKKIKEKI